MFGCFKFITSVISTIIGGIILFMILFPCGGLNYIKNYISNSIKPPQKELVTDAKKIGDFSNIPPNTKLIRVIDMLGASAVISKSEKTGQKMLVINPGWLLNITKSNLNAKTVESELNNLSKKLSNQPVKLSNLEVGKINSFKAFNQTVPYVKIKVSLTGNTNKSMEGIIGVIESPDKTSKLLVSVNDIGKYNQDISQKYFKSIKLNNQ